MAELINFAPAIPIETSNFVQRMNKNSSLAVLRFMKGYFVNNIMIGGYFNQETKFSFTR